VHVTEIKQESWQLHEQEQLEGWFEVWFGELRILEAPKISRARVLNWRRDRC